MDTYIDQYASGGDGTNISPWTGWETAFVGARVAHFSSGYYFTTDALGPSGSMMVVGDGQNQTFIQFGGGTGRLQLNGGSGGVIQDVCLSTVDANVNVLTYSNAAEIQMRNVRIVGNYSNVNKGTGVGIAIIGGATLWFDAVKVFNMAGDGWNIDLENGGGHIIQNSMAQGCGGWHFNFHRTTDTPSGGPVTLSNCQALGVPSWSTLGGFGLFSAVRLIATQDFSAFMSNCVADGISFGPGVMCQNVAYVFSMNGWYKSLSPVDHALSIAGTINSSFIGGFIENGSSSAAPIGLTNGSSSIYIGQVLVGQPGFSKYAIFTDATTKANNSLTGNNFHDALAITNDELHVGLQISQTSTTAKSGGVGLLPMTVAGYEVKMINGVKVKVPYYAN